MGCGVGRVWVFDCVIGLISGVDKGSVVGITSGWI